MLLESLKKLLSQFNSRIKNYIYYHKSMCLIKISFNNDLQTNVFFFIFLFKFNGKFSSCCMQFCLYKKAIGSLSFIWMEVKH